MSRAPKLPPLKKETEDALPQIHSSEAKLNDSGEWVLQDRERLMRLTTAAEVSPRLASLLWELRWVHPADYRNDWDEHDPDTHDPKFELLEKQFQEAALVALLRKDEGFFKQVDYVLQEWRKDESRRKKSSLDKSKSEPAPSDIRFRIASFYERIDRVPRMTEVFDHVNRGLRRDFLKPLESLQIIQYHLKALGYETKEGKNRKAGPKQ
ncbi:hypothetical protein HAHE_37520 [Haloferula helveola]|uniref:Uncharacterized protein n=1 Tax=Haloferula helveola TaxID=490095 RepID=A0ABN6HE59_9BACT|nr:hypothetical protein HAHE_37520 [Haloferula helveola]